MTKRTIITIIAVGLIMGGIGFFAGYKIRPNRPGQFGQFAGRGNPTNQPPKRMGAPGGGLVMGEITSLDAQSITVKTVDGSSKIVIISNGTTYQQTTTAALTDLVVGKKITIMGAANPDGSLTAKTITQN